MASYGKSLVKSTIGLTKSTGKYLVSYVKSSSKTKTPKLSWVSCLIFFRTPFKTYQVDTAVILVGDIPANHHGFFTNMMNWHVIDNRLIYTGELYNSVTGKTLTMIEIDPFQVYLHFKVGDTPDDIGYFTENPNWYQLFFSNPGSKTYRLIKPSLDQVEVKIHNLTRELGSLSEKPIKDRAYQINDPRFHTYKYNVYGREMEHAMYTGLDMDKL